MVLVLRMHVNAQGYFTLLLVHMLFVFFSRFGATDELQQFQMFHNEQVSVKYCVINKDSRTKHAPL